MAHTAAVARFFLDDNFIGYASTPSKTGGFTANPAMLTQWGVLNTTMILNTSQRTPGETQKEKTYLPIAAN